MSIWFTHKQTGPGYAQRMEEARMALRESRHRMKDAEKLDREVIGLCARIAENVEGMKVAS